MWKWTAGILAGVIAGLILFIATTWRHQGIRLEVLDTSHDLDNNVWHISAQLVNIGDAQLHDCSIMLQPYGPPIKGPMKHKLERVEPFDMKPFDVHPIKEQDEDWNINVHYELWADCHYYDRFGRQQWLHNKYADSLF
jgi:hypothetical protein